MLPELSATLQTLLIVALSALVPAAVGYLLKSAGSAWYDFKIAQPDKADAIEKAVALAVTAAEQNGLVAKAKDIAFDKKNYALSIAQDWLKAQGIAIDLALIDAAVEAKVFELFPKPPAA